MTDTRQAQIALLPRADRFGFALLECGFTKSSRLGARHAEVLSTSQTGDDLPTFVREDKGLGLRMSGK